MPEIVQVDDTKYSETFGERGEFLGTDERIRLLEDLRLPPKAPMWEKKK